MVAWHGKVGAWEEREEREREAFCFWIGAKEKLSRICRDDDTGVKENGKFTNIRSSSWFRSNKRGSPHSHHRAPPFVRSTAWPCVSYYNRPPLQSKTPTRILSVRAAGKHQRDNTMLSSCCLKGEEATVGVRPFHFCPFPPQKNVETFSLNSRGNVHVHRCPQDKTRQ